MTPTSPLLAEHEALGATLTDFAGWQMPLRYTSDIAEHTAVREAAGLFDLSHMGEIAVIGRGAERALDYALVGNLTALAVGRARYSMLCQEDGAVIDDVVVYRLAEERFVVVANASNASVVLEELTARAEGFDAHVVDMSADIALVAVQGPRSLEIVSAVAPGQHKVLDQMPYYASATVRVLGHDVLVSRTGYTGEDGFELYVPNALAVELWRALLEAGRPFGMVPAGLAARDSLRLEAGMPLYGHELDRTTTPFEAGLGRVVKLDKTDDDGAPLAFVGRAALESRKGAQPARVLVGLQGLGRRAARAGYPVVSGTQEGAVVVGSVTSGAPSPTLGYPIALAYVTPEVSAEGTELGVDVRGRAEPVRVVPFPFYRRPQG
ncbi:MAG: glycine cleavage system aminomethyltransferase GcvT [Actinomycetales bacterium]|nr:glycine cleavage system aminomethyltransferase GcvT [Actinomycetales bacterium]